MQTRTKMTLAWVALTGLIAAGVFRGANAVRSSHGVRQALEGWLRKPVVQPAGPEGPADPTSREPGEPLGPDAQTNESLPHPPSATGAAFQVPSNSATTRAPGKSRKPVVHLAEAKFPQIFRDQIAGERLDVASPPAQIDRARIAMLRSRLGLLRVELRTEQGFFQRQIQSAQLSANVELPSDIERAIRSASAMLQDAENAIAVSDLDSAERFLDDAVGDIERLRNLR